MRSLRLFGLAVLLTLGACNSSYAPAASEPGFAGIAADESMRVVAEEMEGNPVEVERKLIRTGWVEFQTENLEERRNLILAAVAKYQGYVASDQVVNYPDQQRHTVVARIPEQQFDAFLSEATQGVDAFDRREITIDDVTEEFLDVEARLMTKKELEARYIELLNLAKSVTEILEIERELGNLRADIEAMEGRLKYLQSQVSFSTVSLSFYHETHENPGYGKKFSNGWREGWNNLVYFTLGLVHMWPFLLLAALAWWLFRRYRRSRNINRS